MLAGLLKTLSVLFSAGRRNGDVFVGPHGSFPRVVVTCLNEYRRPAVSARSSVLPFITKDDNQENKCRAEIKKELRRSESA
jgi:hypothetical protein